MRADGKKLEELVSFVEKKLLPQGFEVKTNKRLYNDEGIQIVEFDIEIRGRVESTDIAWLIECRDRPSQGAAPGLWIEQLIGRRILFNFDRVTAVSTTGFAPSALQFAQKEGIELREVKELSVEEFSDWLLFKHINYWGKVTELHRADIIINKEESKERHTAVSRFLASQAIDARFLRAIKSGKLVSLHEAFSAVAEMSMLTQKNVIVSAQYTNDDDHFVVDTAVGPIRVETIVFYGDIYMRETLVPLIHTAEYRQIKNNEPISQVAAFAPQNIHGMNFSVEMHKLSETGETHVIMRKLPDDT